MNYDINQIKEIIPHRHPFLLVDKVIDGEVGSFAVGVKAVSYNEPYFVGHYPEKPVMPGVLIVEALAQVGAIALLSEEESAGKTPLFAGINKARFKRQVQPGDLLTLRCELIKKRGPVGVGKGTATVDGELACECELMFYLA
ncbi:MAG: 3-hydroxyacyl-ACP dehydratase FabZ [Tissierellia bacterium]|nr:3-hydroxyacyl-ACP dehydratase FabZ [Tissierellia bacterium]